MNYHSINYQVFKLDNPSYSVVVKVGHLQRVTSIGCKYLEEKFSGKCTVHLVTMGYDRVAQIPDIRLPGQLNCVPWCLIFKGPQYGTCSMSPLQHLELRSGS